MKDPEFWLREGFAEDDHPHCVETVQSWVNLASSADAEGDESEGDLGQRISMASYTATLRQRRADRRAALVKSSTARHLSEALLGVAPDSGTPGTLDTSLAMQAVQAGQPALPETLQFAQWLSWNASATAAQLNSQCFNYTGQSSALLENFASQVQAVGQKMGSFLTILKRQSSPDAVDALQGTIRDFATHGMNDVLNVVEDKLGVMFNRTSALEEEFHDKLNQVMGQMGDAIGDALANPIGQALSGPVGGLIGEAVDSNKTGEVLGEMLGDTLGKTISRFAADALHDSLEGAIDAAVERASESLEDKLRISDNAASLQALGTQRRTSGSWNQIVTTLTSLVRMLPAAASTLQFARQEVAGLGAHLDTTFEGLMHVGENTFSAYAVRWRLLWSVYFSFLVVLLVGLTFFIFWASGWFGGPNIDELPQAYVEPQTLSERIGCSAASCRTCLSSTLNTELAVWSALILLQAVALGVFVISVFICLLASVKVTLLAGCRQLYILNDVHSCAGSMRSMQGWLESFLTHTPVGDSMHRFCDEEHLLTCNLITEQMRRSTILTTVFSLAGTFFVFQLILNSAVLHERARWHLSKRSNTKTDST